MADQADGETLGFSENRSDKSKLSPEIKCNTTQKLSFKNIGQVALLYEIDWLKAPLHAYAVMLAKWL